jgi:hypothetical protein
MGTLTVSPLYRGLAGRWAYPPVAEGAGTAGAGATVKATELATATAAPAYEMVTTAVPVEPGVNHDVGTLYTQSPLPNGCTAGAALRGSMPARSGDRRRWPTG